MNKRMVTHLIGLGLVGLSATGWAQQQSGTAEALGESHLAIGQRFNIEMNLENRGLELIRYNKLQGISDNSISSKTAILIASGDIVHALNALAESSHDLNYFTYVGTNDILAAAKNGFAAVILEKEGWVKSIVLEKANQLVDSGISLQLASNAWQAQSLMDAYQDAILVDKAIDRSTLEKSKYSAYYVGDSDGKYTILVKKRIIKADVIPERMPGGMVD